MTSDELSAMLRIHCVQFYNLRDPGMEALYEVESVRPRAETAWAAAGRDDV